MHEGICKTLQFSVWEGDKFSCIWLCKQWTNVLDIPILLNFIAQMEKKSVGSYTTCVMFWVHLWCGKTIQKYVVSLIKFNGQKWTLEN